LIKSKRREEDAAIWIWMDEWMDMMTPMAIHCVHNWSFLNFSKWNGCGKLPGVNGRELFYLNICWENYRRKYIGSNGIGFG
jgi:hypothetical protein